MNTPAAFTFAYPPLPANAADWARWARDFEVAHRAFLDRLNAEWNRLNTRITTLETQVAALEPTS